MTKSETLQTSSSSTTPKKLKIAAFFVLLYLLAFLFFAVKVGHAMAIPVIIPVVAFGWLFGMRVGLCAGVLSLPANYLMSVALGIPWWEVVFTKGSGFAGTLGCIIVGTIVGWLLGKGLNWLALKILEWQDVPMEGTFFVVSWGLVFAAVAFGTLVGLLAGLYPAARAARLAPLDALRYE